MRTLPGRDPFQDVWETYDAGGPEALELIEAPVFLYQAEPDVAAAVAKRYAQDGLQPADLRFGVMADAFPVQIRGPKESVGIHLDTFGNRQVRYGLATPAEKLAIVALTDAMEEHVREVIKPEHGVFVVRSGEGAATTHTQLAARERPEDAMANWKKRSKIDLPRRREMRNRIALDHYPNRRAAIAQEITDILHSLAS